MIFLFSVRWKWVSNNFQRFLLPKAKKHRICCVQRQNSVFFAFEHKNQMFFSSKYKFLASKLLMWIIIWSDNSISRSENNTPLHEAVLNGKFVWNFDRIQSPDDKNDQWFFLDNFVNVKKLINKGADTNAKNYFGRTPLHLATNKGQLDG